MYDWDTYYLGNQLIFVLTKKTLLQKNKSFLHVAILGEKYNTQIEHTLWLHLFWWSKQCL